MILKEEYFLEYLDFFSAKNLVFKFLSKMQLLKNLKHKTKNNFFILKSYNNKLFISILFDLINNIVFIKIKTKNKNIKHIRKNIFNYFSNSKFLYSDFLINKNINFYSKFIKFENILRKKIIRTMYSKYGKDWWMDNINKNISKICIKRFKYSNSRFHYIFFSDFSDLKEIILNNWSTLSFLFDNNKEEINKIDYINKKRNSIFHGRFFMDN